ncbi:hypothetical protein H6P81_017926 [Aristolochia fimbriata]|uniref:Clathrin heavy chain n=1 Tax=Aristolochia fimbriata TaxID=158543 RepID=A0AAV7DZZ6_ARIFI|nr:hypothetical protein H6P81_017926 [Aristolochia fimbriata]
MAAANAPITMKEALIGGHLHLVKPYVVVGQNCESIDLLDNFDMISLSQKFEKQELLEMRRIASYIYKKVGRWKQSNALSKIDNSYKDTRDTCSQSGDTELYEELLVYFIDQRKKEWFVSCLFICYELIWPDVALELAWMNNMIDFAFTYLLQFIQEYTSKVDELIKDKIEALSKVKGKEKDVKDMVVQQIMFLHLKSISRQGPLQKLLQLWLNVEYLTKW